METASRLSADRKDYEATFGTGEGLRYGSALQALITNKPRGGIFEQVLGFGMVETGGVGDGTSPLDTFIAELKDIKDFDGISQLYTGLRVFKVDHSVWANMKRERSRFLFCFKS